MVALENDWQHGGFGLYVHWPFCEAKCPYCDFNSHVSRVIDQSAWRNAYLEQLERYAAETPGRILTSIFFGGGTPSLMDPGTTAAVIDTARRLWPVANDLEITLEANPSSVEAARFAAYRSAGVNRVSLGIQALDDTALRKLGRLHDTQAALAALEVARTHFDRVSFDLIYARQDQSMDDWRTEMMQALSLAPDHLSLYQLTIEPDTAFGDRYAAGGLAGLPNDDLAADMYALTQDLCADAGLPAYEVSNHARDGAQSRHNLIYWRYGDYIGIGPGAHGRLTLNGTRFATEHSRMPQTWLTDVKESDRTTLTANACGQEMLLMGLRLVEGIDLRRYECLSGTKLDPSVLQDMQSEGWITLGGDRLVVQKQGFVLLNAILNRLLATAQAVDSV